jgi:hypothetical protein
MQNVNNKISGYRDDLAANGAVIRLRDNTLTLVYEENIFDPNVMHNHRFGKIEYGLIQRDHVPVVLIGFGEVQYDFWINAYDLLPALYRHQLNIYSGKVSFILVSPTTGKIIIDRIFFFNEHFTTHLKSCVQEQWKHYSNESDVRKRIKETTEFVSTVELFEASKRYVCPAVKRYENKQHNIPGHKDWKRTELPHK